MGIGNVHQVRTLIADDSATMRDALRRLLESMPQVSVVGEAANGLEALDLACRLQPDLLIVDNHMPIMGGLAALRTLKDRKPSVRVVLISTILDREVRDAALQSGAIACFEKSTELWDMLESFVLQLYQSLNGKSSAV